MPKSASPDGNPAASTPPLINPTMNNDNLNDTLLSGRTAALARCPDCLEVGGCRRGIPAMFRIEPEGPQVVPLCRTKFYDLTSPKPSNNHTPPVEAIDERQAGAKTGVRLVIGESLCRYLRSKTIRPAQNTQKKSRQRKQRQGDKSPQATSPGSHAGATIPGPETNNITPPILTAPPVSGNSSNLPPPPPPEGTSSQQEVQS